MLLLYGEMIIRFVKNMGVFRPTYKPPSVPFRVVIIYLSHLLPSGIKQLPGIFYGASNSNTPVRLASGGACLM